MQQPNSNSTGWTIRLGSGALEANSATHHHDMSSQYCKVVIAALGFQQGVRRDYRTVRGSVRGLRHTRSLDQCL